MNSKIAKELLKIAKELSSGQGNYIHPHIEDELKDFVSYLQNFAQVIDKNLKSSPPEIQEPIKGLEKEIQRLFTHCKSLLGDKKLWSKSFRNTSDPSERI